MFRAMPTSRAVTATETVRTAMAPEAIAIVVIATVVIATVAMGIVAIGTEIDRITFAIGIVTETGTAMVIGIGIATGIVIAIGIVIVGTTAGVTVIRITAPGGDTVTD
jgi:hypothetical protein